MHYSGTKTTPDFGKMQLTCPRSDHVYISNKTVSQEFGKVPDEIYILTDNDNMQCDTICWADTRCNVSPIYGIVDKML